MRPVDIEAVLCRGCGTPTFLADATCALCSDPPKRVDGTYRCCNGLGEHFDTCAIADAIAQARRAVARSEVRS